MMNASKTRYTIALVVAFALVAVGAIAEQTSKPKSPAAKTPKQGSTAKATPTQPSVAQTPAPTNDKIHWVSYDKGVALQKGTDKHLFVDFTTTWCGWCKKMEKETFSDTAVIHYMNKNFVAVKVWGDQDSVLDLDGYKITQQQLAQSEFQVQGYPTFWFVTPKQERLFLSAGYLTKEQLMSVLPVVAEYRYDTTRNKQNSAPKGQGK
jgi:thioredoxin-related protein